MHIEPGSQLYDGGNVTILFLVALFSSSPLFVLRLLSQDPSVMLTITISSSWDPSHSLSAPFNPYTVPCITTGQGDSLLISS